MGGSCSCPATAAQQQEQQKQQWVAILCPPIRWVNSHITSFPFLLVTLNAGLKKEGESKVKVEGVPYGEMFVHQGGEKGAGNWQGPSIIRKAGIRGQVQALGCWALGCSWLYRMLFSNTGHVHRNYFPGVLSHITMIFLRVGGEGEGGRERRKEFHNHLNYPVSILFLMTPE